MRIVNEAYWIPSSRPSTQARHIGGSVFGRGDENPHDPADYAATFDHLLSVSADTIIHDQLGRSALFQGLGRVESSLRSGPPARAVPGESRREEP